MTSSFIVYFIFVSLSSQNNNNPLLERITDLEQQIENLKFEMYSEKNLLKKFKELNSKAIALFLDILKEQSLENTIGEKNSSNNLEDTQRKVFLDKIVKNKNSLLKLIKNEIIEVTQMLEPNKPENLNEHGEDKKTLGNTGFERVGDAFIDTQLIKRDRESLKESVKQQETEPNKLKIKIYEKLNPHKFNKIVLNLKYDFKALIDIVYVCFYLLDQSCVEIFDKTNKKKEEFNIKTYQLMIDLFELNENEIVEIRETFYAKLKYLRTHLSIIVNFLNDSVKISKENTKKVYISKLKIAIQNLIDEIENNLEYEKYLDKIIRNKETIYIFLKYIVILFGGVSVFLMFLKKIKFFLKTKIGINI